MRSGRCGGDEQRDGAAHRVADQVHRAASGQLEVVDHGAGMRLERVVVVERRARAAEAGQVDRLDRQVGCAAGRRSRSSWSTRRRGRGRTAPARHRRDRRRRPHEDLAGRRPRRAGRARSCTSSAGASRRSDSRATRRLSAGRFGACSRRYAIGRSRRLRRRLLGSGLLGRGLLGAPSSRSPSSPAVFFAGAFFVAAFLAGALFAADFFAGPSSPPSSAAGFLSGTRADWSRSSRSTPPPRVPSSPPRPRPAARTSGRRRCRRSAAAPRSRRPRGPRPWRRSPACSASR